MKNNNMPNLSQNEPYIGMPINLSGNDEFDMVQNWSDDERTDRAGRTDRNDRLDMTDRNNNDNYQDKNIDNWPVAMAYVPWQKWTKTYGLEQALTNGTIFPDLNLPLRGFGGGGK